MKDGVALTLDFSNVMPQVSSTMLVTLWLILGIEGAVVVSGKAKSQAAVRKATTIGFLVTLAALHRRVASALGVYSQAEVGSMADPSMAAIMLNVRKMGRDHGERRRDRLGAELLARLDAHAGRRCRWPPPKAASSPKCFVKENKNGSPSTSLLWTTIVVQVVLIISFS